VTGGARAITLAFRAEAALTLFVPELLMGTPMESWPRRHRITADEYHRMAEVGLLAPDARVELIEGEIIDMAPIGKDHTSVVDQLTRLFIRAVGDDAIVRVQGSVRLSPISEPEPDLVLLKPRPDFYRNEWATAADTLLVIEVSDSTLRYDRDFKVPFYARHGVPEVWIFDLQHDRLLVYGAPSDAAYARQTSIARPETMLVTALSGVVVDLSSVFAPSA
jgi:Uma2 family endonuclease